MSIHSPDYFTRIKELIPAVIQTLANKGIDEKHLQFGGEAEKEPKISIPTDARSEFLANRAMGDWAEGALKESFMSSNGIAVEISHYGDTDSLAAGEPGFKENYLRAKEETRRWGKRPDVLIFPAGTVVPSDLTALSREEADDFAEDSIEDLISNRDGGDNFLSSIFIFPLGISLIHCIIIRKLCLISSILIQ